MCTYDHFLFAPSRLLEISAYFVDFSFLPSRWPLTLPCRESMGSPPRPTTLADAEMRPFPTHFFCLFWLFRRTILQRNLLPVAVFSCPGYVLMCRGVSFLVPPFHRYLYRQVSVPLRNFPPMTSFTELERGTLPPPPKISTLGFLTGQFLRTPLPPRGVSKGYCMYALFFRFFLPRSPASVIIILPAAPSF